MPALLRTLLGALAVAIYVAVGALVHLYLERDNEDGAWTYVDCLYFVSMTTSTVGYGNLSPSSEGARWWTILMIVVGVSVVFPLLASLLEDVTAPLTRAGRDALDRMFPQTGVDIEGDGSVDYKIPRHPLVFYSKNLSPSLLLNLVVQLISAAIFCALEGEWTFSDAFYHCLVTATTVGYGDVTIATQGGSLWAAIHMGVAVILVAELLSTVGELSSQRAETMRRIQQLQRRADSNLLANLMKHVKQIRPEGSDVSIGINELEFTLSMLIELEMIAWEHAELFIKQFRKFDATGDGRLDAADMQAHMDKQKNDIEKRLAANLAKEQAFAARLHIHKGVKHFSVLPHPAGDARTHAQRGQTEADYIPNDPECSEVLQRRGGT